MDPTALVDLAVALVQSNPKTAGLLALVPFVQGLGLVLARFLPAHTIAARWGAKVAAFPIRLPPAASAKPEPDPSATR